MISIDRKPRRWLQFSLRTLFIVMLVVAAFFGGRESMRPAIEAERAKAAIASAQAEWQHAQALMTAAYAQAVTAQAESDRVLARRQEYDSLRLKHDKLLKDAAVDSPSLSDSP